MRKNIIWIVSICSIVVLIIIGLITKSNYKDFNEKEDAVDDFVVGILPDDLADVQIEKMNNELDECRIIVAAECVEEALFRFGCITERVRVKQVFAGDDIREGDVIDVGRASSCLFLDESMYVNEKPLLNMGFVRGMKKGSTYLIFLEQEKETNEKYRLFVQPQNLLMAPIFEYGQTDSNVLNSITTDSYHNVYKNIKESELFLMSEKTIEQMYNLKSDLLQRYSLEGDNDD